MRINPDDPREASACTDCLRRGWLLDALSARLDYVYTDREKMMEVLALDDRELIQALAGARRSELETGHARFARPQRTSASEVEAVCRHDPRFPAQLTFRGAPRLLHVAGGVGRLRALTDAPVVAIVGSRRASDYGIEVAQGLARGLVASGVTVAGGLCDGIGVAALYGALEVDGRAVCVLGGGMDAGCPARRRRLLERVARHGCAVAELPSGAPPRRWGSPASERIIVGLGELAITVEAEGRPHELAAARLARALGRTIGAVPGRVTSPLSAGTNSLLEDGARLIRGPADALELLGGRQAPGGHAGQPQRRALEPTLERMLWQIGAGSDTPGKLAREGQRLGRVLQQLSELELLGLLARGDGGRYVPREPVPRPPGGVDRPKPPPEARN